MSNYRLAYSAGSTVFLTWVTYRLAPLFSHPDTVSLLRQAVREAKREAGFQIVAAAICTLSGRYRLMITITLSEWDGLKFCSRDRSEATMLNPKRFHLLAESIERAMCGSVGFGNILCEAKPSCLIISTTFITTRLSMAWLIALISGLTPVFTS